MTEPERGRWPAELAGPALIVLAVIVALHGFVLRGLLSTQHPDLFGFWLPQYCSLGRALRAGHVPAWNPFAMAGVRFAGDPQSGWLNLPAMALFAALPCGRAMGAFVALQPMLAGVGLFAFLRGERLSRAASTTGGLMLALALAGSRLGLFLPFPSAFAWTAVLLACTGAFLRAARPRARVAWLLAAAMAWGQLLAAYPAHGVILGTAATAVAVGATARGSKEESGGGRRVLLLAAALAVAAVVVNLGWILPRASYLPASSYGEALSAQAQVGARATLAWPLTFALAPGGHLGTAALSLAFVAFAPGPHRRLALWFGGFAVVTYLFGISTLIGPVARSALGVPGLDLLAHYPERFSLGILLALPILAAIGFDAWWRLDGWPSRLRWLVPGVLVWVVAPVLVGAPAIAMAIPLAGLAVGAGALWLTVRRPGLGSAFPAGLAVVLVLGCLVGQGAGAFSERRVYPHRVLSTTDVGWFVPMLAPEVDPASYLGADPIAAALRGAPYRYLSFDRRLLTNRGYLEVQGPAGWPFMAGQRGMVFDVSDAQGYDPVQLARYWDYVRALDAGDGRISYNASFFRTLSPGMLDLLQVGAIVAPGGSAPLPGWTAAATDGPWTLWIAPTAPSIVSIPARRVVVPDRAASLRAVTAPGFDPSADLVLEGAGTSGAPPQGGLVDVARVSVGDQAATFDVHTSGAAEVLVRIPFDSGWRASVDGIEVPVRVADHLMMSVEVPAGTHRVRLAYEDPSIAVGLAGSAVGLAALAVAWWWAEPISARLRRRRRAR